MKRIVIDTDSLSRLFDKSNKEHIEYEPLRKSIIEKRQSIIVYGGTKYMNELKRACKFLRIFAELKKAGIAFQLDVKQVDSEEIKIIKLSKDSRFNDHNIIAIVLVGNCNIICSCDSHSHSHFKNKIYYSGKLKPKIYNGLGSCSVLN